MSSASGVNNSSINSRLMQLNIAAGGDVSDAAMQETKEMEKAKQLEAAELMHKIDVPNAMNANGDIIVTSFNGPEIKSNYQPDLGKAADFLRSSEFQQGQEAVKRNLLFTTNLFTDQTKLLIMLKEALRDAKDGQAAVSSRLSDLSGKITVAMTDRIITKGLETYAMNVAGSIMTAAVSFAGTSGGARNSANSRAETKSYHNASSRSNQARIEQTDALKTMQKQGKENTTEYNDLEKRLQNTVEQGRELDRTHELSKTKFDSRQNVHMAIQGLSSAAGGALGAASSITESRGEAEIALHRATQEQDNEMKQKAEQVMNEIEKNITDALSSLRSLEDAAIGVINSVARNI